MSHVLDVADLAAEQWGLVTTAQARSLGVSAQAVARLTNQGALERVTQGVYRVTGAPPSPLDDLRAAWLALEPARRLAERLRDERPAVVSHRSAAAIHELGDLEADESEFTSVERKQTRRPDLRIHRGQVDTGEWTVVDGLPVTTVIRTVADLAAAHIDGGHLASVVRDALIRRQVDDQQLAAALRRYAHRYGARTGSGEALLSRLLQESGVSESIERAVELAAPTTPGDSPTMKAVADLARYTQSPAMQRLAKQYAEVAEVSRLARTISEINRPPRDQATRGLCGRKAISSSASSAAARRPSSGTVGIAPPDSSRESCGCVIPARSANSACVNPSSARRS